MLNYFYIYITFAVNKLSLKYMCNNANLIAMQS